MSDRGLIIGGVRLPAGKERALNALLARHTTFDGVQLYRISWAADDNKGLRKKHGVGCPKTSPYDWQCECPHEDPKAIPLCFHECAMSYHLLGWEPPQPANSMYETACAEDFSKGSWACVMHFIDPKTGKPVDPTASIVERMIPLFMELRETDLAARHGFHAVVQHNRQKRRDAEVASAAREDVRYKEEAKRLLLDSTYVNWTGEVKMNDSESLIATP